MLTLPVKKKWFDMIVSGEKKEEYRRLSTRYGNTFEHAANGSDHFVCRIRNGYSISSPSALITCSYHIGYGKPEWGAEPNVKYYVLSILSVEKE